MRSGGGMHHFCVKLSENYVYAWVERILIQTVDRTLASVKMSDSKGALCIEISLRPRNQADISITALQRVMHKE